MEVAEIVSTFLSTSKAGFSKKPDKRLHQRGKNLTKIYFG
jgi:hypothetical protein